MKDQARTMCPRSGILTKGLFLGLTLLSIQKEISSGLNILKMFLSLKSWRLSLKDTITSLHF